MESLLPEQGEIGGPFHRLTFIRSAASSSCVVLCGSQHGEKWAETYFSALEHVILEPLQPVLVADGFHGTNTPEGGTRPRAAWGGWRCVSTDHPTTLVGAAHVQRIVGARR